MNDRASRLSLEQASHKMKQYYDRQHQAPMSFKIGDKVWLDGSDLCTLRPSKKLDHKQLGPFKITKVNSLTTYRLQLPKTWKLLTNTFHISKLRPANKDTTLHPKPIPLPPDIIDNVPEYEVDKILGSRLTLKGLQYLVSWKGYR